MSNTRTFHVTIEQVIAYQYEVAAHCEETAEGEALDLWRCGLPANAGPAEGEQSELNVLVDHP